MPAWLVPAIQGAVALGGMLLGNRAAKKRQEEMNEYNAPKNQMARFQEAGLNPNLAYGQVADSRMASAPTLNAPQVDPVPARKYDFSLADYQQIVNQYELNKLTRAQSAKVAEDAKISKSNAEYTKYENDSYMRNGTFKNDLPYWRFFQRIFDRPGMSGVKGTMQTDFQNR